MKNKILTLAVLSATSLTFLSACGSSPSADAGAMPEVVAARLSSLRLAGNFNNGGTTSRDDNTYDYTYSPIQETLTLRVGSNNTLIMIVNGVENVLTRAEGRDDYWQVKNGIGVSINANTSLSSNNIIDVLTGKDDARQGTYVLYDTTANDFSSGATSFDIDSTFGFATVGIQTPASVVANQTATATYTGRMDFRTYPNTLTAREALSRVSYFGDLSMNVNFDANTIRGTANLSKSVEDTGTDVLVGVVTFASAPIIGNGFDGDFTLDNALHDDIGLNATPTGNYSGNFFGPNANDLAGVMRFNGTNANENVFGYGGFGADRQ